VKLAQTNIPTAFTIVLICLATLYRVFKLIARVILLTWGGIEQLATGWTVRDSNPGGVQEFFLFSETFNLSLGPTQPPIQWVPGPFRGREFNHLPSSCAEVENGWSHAYILPSACVTWAGVTSETRGLFIIIIIIIIIIIYCNWVFTRWQ
jgi:hypothetical protein